MRISSIGLLPGWLPVITCLLLGCYAPSALPGSPCAASARCPADQQCVAGFCSEAAGAAVDAGAIDAAAVGTAPGDAAAAATCQTSELCTTAPTLGTVSGDTAGPTLTARGSRAAWFRIRVTEDDDSLDGVPLHVLAQLTPPAGADFDVFVYVNPDADILECANTSGVATTSGIVKQVRASWGEDVVPDGEDDSRDVSIEVRPRSATCAPGAQWTLSIQGNWN